jgi:hypothetical protein
MAVPNEFKLNNVNGKLAVFPNSNLKKGAGETQPYLSISKELIFPLVCPIT